jgi:ribose transport system substrate-binding protein
MKAFFRLACFVTALSLGACGQSNGPNVVSVASPSASSPTVPPVTKLEIGLVMKTLTNPFFVEMERGARRAESELPIKLTVKTASQETSIEQQIQIVEDLIARKVAAIVIAPGDSQRLIPVLKKAADSGIKIINIDNRLDPQTVQQTGMQPIPFVSVDNDAGGYKAGKFLAEDANTPTEAAILEGLRTADNAKLRMQGARRALLENKNIKIVASESANWEIDKAYTATKAIFAQYPKVKLLFAANDMMAIGAVKYLQESGNKTVKVVGYDALAEALSEITAGRMVGTIDQQAAEQGFQGVVLAHRLIKGESVQDVTSIETKLVTVKGPTR